MRSSATCCAWGSKTSRGSCGKGCLPQMSVHELKERVTGGHYGLQVLGGRPARSRFETPYDMIIPRGTSRTARS